ncbi:hypothetical protein FS749_008121, partial [Ceratobasidium sp. UAMH 11750]
MTIHPPNAPEGIKVPKRTHSACTQSNGIRSPTQQRPLHAVVREAPRRGRWSDAVGSLAAYVGNTALGTLQMALNYCKSP